MTLTVDTTAFSDTTPYNKLTYTVVGDRNGGDIKDSTNTVTGSCTGTSCPLSGFDTTHTNTAVKAGITVTGYVVATDDAGKTAYSSFTIIITGKYLLLSLHCYRLRSYLL
jgi:hypothetical protein